MPPGRCRRASCRLRAQTVDSLCHPLVRFDMRQSRPVRRLVLLLLSIVVLSPLGVEVTRTQQRRKPFVPVTDAMLQNPAPADWLMWRRTLNSWGYSPLDQINRDNVAQLRMVWTRPLAPGQPGGHAARLRRRACTSPTRTTSSRRSTPRPAICIWEYRRDAAERRRQVLPGSAEINRNLAIYGNLHHRHQRGRLRLRARRARPGKLAWETKILDYKPAARSRARARSSPTAR